LTNVDDLDSKFEKFVKGKKFKQCPKCKYWVEKSQVSNCLSIISLLNE